MRSVEPTFENGQVHEEPARIKHGHRFKPERIRLRDHDMEWWIEEILNDQRGGGSTDDPIRREYRFRVTGPIPGRRGERGTFVMIATSYERRTSWWVRPA